MANCCWFEMAVKGFKNEEGKDFVKNIFSCKDEKHWIGLMGEAYVVDNGDWLKIEGDCRWSVSSSMLDVRDIDNGYYPIKDLSKDLGLDIEVYSSECGLEFQEHFIIKNGIITTEEETDYEEVCLCENYEEFINENDWYIDEYGTPTREEYDDWVKKYDEYMPIGGFESWDFEILEEEDEQDL